MLQCSFSEFQHNSLTVKQDMKSNPPCLRPLLVAQEVRQVLADPQVPEYRLFQLGLEVLSLPIFQNVVSHA